MKQLFVSLVTTLVFLAILLLSAGQLGYGPAWAYAALGVVMNLCMRFILRHAPEVARERSRPGEGAKGWDKALLGIGFLLTLATLVVAGLDAGRFHRLPQPPWAWCLVGLTLCLAGGVLFLLALRENRFFSAVVRIQTDRSHTVCTTGVYRVVRHPGYAGMLLGTIGLPFLFTSVWSGIPVLLSSVLLIVRTHLEDGTLEKELSGYRDYQQTTRFRLFPGVW